MFCKSSVHLLIYFSILFIFIHSTRLKRETVNYAPRCQEQSTAIDQVIDQTPSSRKKRFVLFPEFENYLGDERYIHRPKDFIYWIANFYPKKIVSNYVQHVIEDMIRQMNTVIDTDITVQLATSPGEANFHYSFFDYTKCPTDDLPEATIDNIQILDPLSIYSVELTRKSRYRAHGGIHIIENDRPISSMKFNTQQTYLYSDDFIYDPTIYTCVDETNQCEVDLYWVLLHETLHGFGIEHTTNARQPTPPNPHMQSVMHFANFRILCHDDIRAIRAVYKLPVKRENVMFDDTCRRDFPMSTLQKVMFLIGRWIIYLSILFLMLSLIIFILTLIYILIRSYFSRRKSDEFEKPPIMKPRVIKNEKVKRNNNKPHGYLWHDDMI